ncbi:hypothetical protein CYMTET_26811 [Cymbomonas tetramitiformis]|uniref:Right handed beta helix domain-containing protein n=1 Tax=Cymbomonas tetramitiformis TaxID=36881 RepID=A0AAE0FQY9_9CHLO|nr:hypothetical protein CYMTET_26811 [Cymbomonas tetramitiformis]
MTRRTFIAFIILLSSATAWSDQADIYDQSEFTRMQSTASSRSGVERMNSASSGSGEEDRRNEQAQLSRPPDLLHLLSKLIPCQDCPLSDALELRSSTRSPPSTDYGRLGASLEARSYRHPDSAPLATPRRLEESSGCPATCNGYSCDEVSAARPEYTCAALEVQGGCDCSGCACPNDTPQPPLPPPPPTPSAPSGCPATCNGYSCDEVSAARPEYTCAALEVQGGCDCSGCACPNDTPQPPLPPPPPTPSAPSMPLSPPQPPDAPPVTVSNGIATITDPMYAEQQLRMALEDEGVHAVQLYTSLVLSEALPSVSRAFEVNGSCPGNGTEPEIECEIHGGGRVRLFAVEKGGELQLSNLALRGGLDELQGGGLLLAESAKGVLRWCIIEGCHAEQGQGGGVSLESAHVELYDCQVVGNTGGWEGTQA